jgi:hypothetical protein
MLATHLQIVPRPRKYGSIHPLLICFHGVVFNYLSTGATLPLPYVKHHLCVFAKRHTILYLKEKNSASSLSNSNES